MGRGNPVGIFGSLFKIPIRNALTASSRYLCMEVTESLNYWSDSVWCLECANIWAFPALQRIRVSSGMWCCDAGLVFLDVSSVKGLWVPGRMPNMECLLLRFWKALGEKDEPVNETGWRWRLCIPSKRQVTRSERNSVTPQTTCKKFLELPDWDITRCLDNLPHEG